MLAREVLLAERRRVLSARADVLRAESARLLEGFAPVFGAADKATAAVGWARRYAPLIVGAMSLVLALRRPKRIVGFVGRAWSAWQLYRRARERFDALIQRLK